LNLENTKVVIDLSIHPNQPLIIPDVWSHRLFSEGIDEFRSGIFK